MLVLGNVALFFTRWNRFKFLGNTIIYTGIPPDPEQVNVIADYKLSKKVKELRRLLGMLNFYRKFLTSSTKYLIPLNKFLEGRRM